MILSYMLQRTLIQISLASFDECTLNNPCQGDKVGISARFTDMFRMHRFHMVATREQLLVEVTVLIKPVELEKIQDFTNACCGCTAMQTYRHACTTYMCKDTKLKFS